MDNKSLSHTRWKCQYHIVFIPKYRKPANKKSSVFLKKISKIRFDILCITFKPPEMPALKVVI